MSKSTSTRNLTEIIMDDMVQITSSESYYKAFNTKESLDKGTLKKSLTVLNVSGIFSDIVDWTYDNVSAKSDTEDFIIYGDTHDKNVGEIIILNLLVNDGFEIEDVEKELRKTIFSDGKMGKKITGKNL